MTNLTRFIHIQT